MRIIHLALMLFTYLILFQYLIVIDNRLIDDILEPEVNYSLYVTFYIFTQEIP